MALVLIFWWGPRILIPFYLNAILSAGLWGLSKVYFWPLYGLPETSYAFLAWYLFAIQRKGAYWLPNTKEFISFLTRVILFPLIIYKFFLESVYLLLDDHPANSFFDILLKTGLGEFISNVGLAIPVLYFFSSRMQAMGLTITQEPVPEPKFMIAKKPLIFFIEVIIILLVLLAFSFLLNFEKFWFVYCLVSLYAAIRFGFEAAILTNLYIFFITYMFPLLFHNQTELHYLNDLSLVNVYVGNSLLYVFAAITGRVISDLRLADETLQQKNAELELANKELDHFVYSASHDLSAPLKSIRGLVGISKLSNDLTEKENYFAKIEGSVQRLELFIGEVLDYSRNKRLNVLTEPVHLTELFSEIFETLRYGEGFQRIKIDMSGIGVNEIQTDKMRLKIILNNLLSNAIKFQKEFQGHEPVIQISSIMESDGMKIVIQDNGEGIKPEFQDRIFNMFYRASHNAKGSGLGLYIAKEAADKMGGTISVKSDYGIGSTFILKISGNNRDIFKT
jgi:signal transduction histidine kinase